MNKNSDNLFEVIEQEHTSSEIFKNKLDELEEKVIDLIMSYKTDKQFHEFLRNHSETYAAMLVNHPEQRDVIAAYHNKVYAFYQEKFKKVFFNTYQSYTIPSFKRNIAGQWGSIKADRKYLLSYAYDAGFPKFMAIDHTYSVVSILDFRTANPVCLGQNPDDSLDPRMIFLQVVWTHPKYRGRGIISAMCDRILTNPNKIWNMIAVHHPDYYRKPITLIHDNPPKYIEALFNRYCNGMIGSYKNRPAIIYEPPPNSVMSK